jgi:hypothetical protein
MYFHRLNGVRVLPEVRVRVHYCTRTVLPEDRYEGTYEDKYCILLSKVPSKIWMYGSAFLRQYNVCRTYCTSGSTFGSTFVLSRVLSKVLKYIVISTVHVTVRVRVHVFYFRTQNSTRRRHVVRKYGWKYIVRRTSGSTLYGSPEVLSVRIDTSVLPEICQYFRIDTVHVLSLSQNVRINVRVLNTFVVNNYEGM